MKSRNLFKGFFEGVRPELWVCLFLVAATLVIYHPVGSYEFINYDDPDYVVDNHQVRKGLTYEGAKWAFTSMHAANWHPITWLSHMLDVQLYGMHAGGHHFTNVLFHILNSMLLFLLLHRMTGALWRSAMVAALFAVHPLHVESVAWISERKDVLSAFFGFLALMAYVEYVRRPGWLRYGAALLFYALGLMSKPMVVTLPFLMMLLDYWPLNRYAEEGGFRRFAALVREKLPFFALSVASCVVTMIAQSRGGAISSLDAYSFGVRLANVVAAYVIYMGKMIWPVNLSVFYPHPGMRPLWQVITAFVLIVGISAAALLWAKRRPWFAVGWLWYLGTLVPMIGIIQVGLQSMADRYAYAPFVGLYIVSVWALSELFNKIRYGHCVAVVLLAVVLTGLAATARSQAGRWQNSRTLFTHALEVTQDNFIASNALGHVEAKSGKMEEAVVYYKNALLQNPGYQKSRINLAHALIEQGKISEGIRHYEETLRIDSLNALAHNELGLVRIEQGRFPEAIKHFRAILKNDPDDGQAWYNMGLSIIRKEKLDEIHTGYFALLDERLSNPETVQDDLFKVLKIKDAVSRAHYCFSETLRLEPENSMAHNNIGALYLCEGKIPEAVLHFQMALRLKSDNAIARNNLSRSQNAAARIDQEITDSQKHLESSSDKAIFYYRLAKLNTLRGHFREAEKWYKKAMEVDSRFEKALHDLIVIYILERDHDKMRSELLNRHKEIKMIDGFMNLLQAAPEDELLISKYLQDLGLCSAAFEKVISAP